MMGHPKRDGDDGRVKSPDLFDVADGPDGGLVVADHDHRIKRVAGILPHMVDIVRDDDVRSGDPRIAGTRISVLDVKRRVIEGGEDAFAVPAEYDLDPAAVFAALSYYYHNPDEMQTLEAEHEERTEELRRTSRRLRDRHEGNVPSEEA
jgi:uncharacterized protein (DUF433 family)